MYIPVIDNFFKLVSLIVTIYFPLWYMYTHNLINWSENDELHWRLCKKPKVCMQIYNVYIFCIGSSKSNPCLSKWTNNTWKLASMSWSMNHSFSLYFSALSRGHFYFVWHSNSYKTYNVAQFLKQIKSSAAFNFSKNKEKKVNVKKIGKILY